MIIYNLVTTIFNDSFEAELEAIFDNIFSIKTDEMIRNYSSSINNDLTIIINILNQNVKKIQNVVASATSLKIDLKWILLRREITALLNDLDSFDDNFDFDISYQKNYIHEFYYYEIFDTIGYIKSGFDYQVSLGKRQLEVNLTLFNVDDKVQKII